MKWKHSDSSNSDSVELMTLLMTLIFDFHQVIAVFTTPSTTPSLLNTSLKITVIALMYAGED